MEYFDKEYGLEIWGDYACFTRPEFKVERVSYDVITPSAARNIFQAIFWKPAIEWHITRIEVLNPVKWISIRRNEVGAIGAATPSAKPIIATANRQQKNTLMLRDVRYRIYARMVFIPKHKRTADDLRPDAQDENPGKYQAMFERRASKGQCFTMPYLGTRECAAGFKLLPDNAKDGDDLLNETREIGLMLYDMDYSNPKNIQPMFFNAVINKGVIEVPDKESEEVLK